MCGRAGTLKLGSVAFCEVLNVAVAAVLGSGGTSGRASFSGRLGLSVCGPGGTGGNDVSIFSVRRFWPDNLLLRTEAFSLTALAAVGVVSDVSSD